MCISLVPTILCQIGVTLGHSKNTWKSVSTCLLHLGQRGVISDHLLGLARTRSTSSVSLQSRLRLADGVTCHILLTFRSQVALLSKLACTAQVLWAQKLTHSSSWAELQSLASHLFIVFPLGETHQRIDNCPSSTAAVGISFLVPERNSCTQTNSTLERANVALISSAVFQLLQEGSYQWLH